jgi:glycosyltransferase involved in cell wall biosynthesis
VKIAFVSQPWNRIAPPVDIGSIAILSYETARLLSGTHDVSIFSKLDPDQAAEEALDGVTYRRVPVGRDKRRAGFAAWFDRFRSKTRPYFSSAGYYRGYIDAVARELGALDVDIVQIFNFSQFAPIIKTHAPRAKVVLRMSCEWLSQLDRGIVAPRIEATDAIIGCSDFITGGIRETFPEYAGRCATIHNGRRAPEQPRVHSPRASANERGRRIVYVGRVSPEKGIHTLVEAFLMVKDEFPDLTLDIIGPKGSTPVEFVLGLTRDEKVRALEPYFKDNYVSTLEAGLPDDAKSRVRFRGKVPHDDLGPEYSGSDALVFPSIWDEPSGNPPIEAMAHGVPVISTRTGGTAEYVIDGETGILVDPGDTEGLASAMRRILTDEDLRAAMGAAGRKRVVEYLSYERFTEELAGLYTRLLDGPL